MAEKLTKTAIKDELTRRINYFENRYGFTIEESVNDMFNNPYRCIAFGRYLSLYEQRRQIERQLFIGGFAYQQPTEATNQ